MLLVLFGILLLYLTLIQPVARTVSLEKDLNIRQQLKHDKLKALQRRHPILRLLTHEEIEEEFNIDRLYYGSRFR